MSAWLGRKRAWWAISGKKQKAPKRPSKGSDMEIDSLPDKEPRKDITAGPSILKKTSKAKNDEKPGKDEKSIRRTSRSTTFDTFMMSPEAL